MRKLEGLEKKYDFLFGKFTAKTVQNRERPLKTKV